MVGGIPQKRAQPLSLVGGLEKRRGYAHADWLGRQLKSAKLEIGNTPRHNGASSKLYSDAAMLTTLGEAEHAVRQVGRYTADATGSIVSLVEIANTLDVIQGFSPVDWERNDKTHPHDHETDAEGWPKRQNRVLNVSVGLLFGGL
jgi:hypothetical protein